MAPFSQVEALSAATCDAPPAWPIPDAPRTVVGSGTAASCTTGALQAAVDNGGYVTFDCGSEDVTIPVDYAVVASNVIPTIIDGGGKITLDGGNNNHRILTVSNNRSLSARNLHFINGSIPQTGDDLDMAHRGQFGGGAIGGLYLARVEIINSTFDSNVAGYGGGAVMANIGALTIVDSTFTNNTSLEGGAVYTLFSDVVIVNSTFTNNTATGGEFTLGGGYGDGGAIATDGAKYTSNPNSLGIISLCGVNINNNVAHASGGGLYLWTYQGDITTVDRSVIAGNTALPNPVPGHSRGDGGGVRFGQGHVTLSNSSLLSNSANANGGAVYLLFCHEAPGLCNVSNSTFHGNTAGGFGSVIFGGDFSARNVTFAGNGAGALFGSNVVLNSAIFESSDSGSFCSDTGSGADVLQWPNGGTDRKCVPQIAVADPKLAMPANNGGPTPTMLLGQGSAAINAAPCTNSEPVDQRAMIRPDPASAGLPTACDIGAVEVNSLIDSIFMSGFEQR